MSQESLEGQTIGNYEVIAEMGRGGMGVVYRAYEQSLMRPVALKILAPHLANDAGFVERFTREARAVAALDHPNIVTVYSVGEDKGHYYIAMQYVKGRTLYEIVRERGRLDMRLALDIARQAAEALRESHGRGIIHRDIKPPNIMLDEAGRVKVMDFGLAKVMEGMESLTVSGATLGTPLYMSPEQAEGEPATERSDIYSLGATLFELLAGRPPFEADTPYAIIYQIVYKGPRSLREFAPDLPGPVVQLVEKMMAKDPAGRHASADEVVRVIQQILAQPHQAPTTPMRSPFRGLGVEKRRSRRSILALAGAAGAAVLASAGYLGFSILRSPTGGTEPRPEPDPNPRPNPQPPPPGPYAADNARAIAKCQERVEHLKTLLGIYAKENKGFYPVLSHIPGRLTLGNESSAPIFPAYIMDLSMLVCPNDPDIRLFQQPGATSDVETMLDDFSYFYLGYAIANEKMLEGFATVYKEMMGKGIPLRGELDVPEGYGTAGSTTIQPLREGIQRFFITDINSPHVPDIHIPVLIERIGNHSPDGGNVLFIDGRIEFIEYPGKWPMTESAVAILNELDQFA